MAEQQLKRESSLHGLSHYDNSASLVIKSVLLIPSYTLGSRPFQHLPHMTVTEQCIQHNSRQHRGADTV